MTTAASAAVRYSARYFDASPTWFAWNKLSIADVYALREDSEFWGQHIWFWLNHPIRFIRIVGFVAQIDVVAGGRYILLTVDDGSGANIEVKLERPVAYKEHNGAVYSSKTVLDNVEVTMDLGLPVIVISKHRLDIGTIIKAQGKIESYNKTRQLLALALDLVSDTNEEAVHWSKVADWKRRVLRRPWVLSAKEKAEIDANFREEERVAAEQARKRKKQKAKLEEKRKAHEEKLEAKRQGRTEYYNQGALPGSSVIKMPWDDG